MKKSVKIGLWLTALGVAGAVQEWLSQNTQETNKDIQWVFAQNPDWKGGEKPKTYTATAADFQKHKLDSLDAVQIVSLLNDTINKLVASYGKEWLNDKINEINKEYPDFQNLPEGKQKEIIMKKFVEKKSFAEFIWDFVIIIFIIGLAWKLARLTSGRGRFR